MSSRPFRFFCSGGQPRSHRELLDRARRAESLGYETLVLLDHLFPTAVAPLPALTAVASATTRLRVGTFVLNNDLRHPAVLAQELATIDMFTEGRLVIGLGAGWNRSEYEQAGIPFDRTGTRIRRMEESITVLKGLLAGGPFSFEGEHYRISAMEGWASVQRPHPPFMIGGGGPRVLGVAAREAQIVSLAPRLPSPEHPDVLGCLAAGTAEKVAAVRAGAGDREVDICTFPSPPLPPITITNDRRAKARDVIDLLRSGFGVELSEEDVLDSPHVFIGTVDELVEKCLDLRERFGINVVQVRTEIEEFAPVVERLAGR